MALRPSFLCAEAFRPVQDLRKLHVDQLCAKDGPKLFFIGASETEALRRLSDRRCPERMHFLSETSGTHHRPDSSADRLLFRGAEYVERGTPALFKVHIGCGISPCQRIEPETPAIALRLPERPEKHRTIREPEHFFHIGRICEGIVLENDKVGLFVTEPLAEKVYAEKNVSGNQDRGVGLPQEF